MLKSLRRNVTKEADHLLDWFVRRSTWLDACAVRI